MPDFKSQLHICSCNGTIPFDPKALSHALDLENPVSVACGLCRHEAGKVASAAAAPKDALIACTQEKAFFEDLASRANLPGQRRYVNIREAAGWSAEGKEAQPKIAALLAAGMLPDPEPVPAITYRSEGSVLIIGPMDAAVAWADHLKDQLEVSVLVFGASRGGELPASREYSVHSGTSVKITGYLGKFNVDWEQENPIDLSVCTRCNACVRVCPEGAIGYDYQVNPDVCRDHQACVAACKIPGAIDFDRTVTKRSDTFDLVFDLSPVPLIRLPHPPKGYAAPGRDALDQARAAQALLGLVGEFEKPKYFAYKESICAHGRNRISGCMQCIDVCSTGAIRSAGDKVEVEPHLCMGCGGCAATCPSGAMRYAYPSVADLGLRIKTLLSTYKRAGGKDACLLFHDGKRGESLIMELGRRGKGLPARVIPVALHDIASVGLDILLGAVAYGASQCVILYQREEPESYIQVLERQTKFGQLILNGLGYQGAHLKLVVADDAAELEAAVWPLQDARGVGQAAAFNLTNEKRRTLEFIFDHLLKQAPQPAEVLEMPAGAPWGAVELDKQKCTLCMSCVGACPESALMDTPDFPRLKFVERNCVQCGLCVKTCPENALKLTPRLLLTDDARRERVLNETEPFHCVRCAKPFGTRMMIENMLGRLAGHSMFASPVAQRRLQMCADCRVVDMMENKDKEATIFDL